MQYFPTCIVFSSAPLMLLLPSHYVDIVWNAYFLSLMIIIFFPLFGVLILDKGSFSYDSVEKITSKLTIKRIHKILIFSHPRV